MSRDTEPLCLQSEQTLFSGRLTSSLSVRVCLSVVALSCLDMMRSFGWVDGVSSGSEYSGKSQDGRRVLRIVATTRRARRAFHVRQRLLSSSTTKSLVLAVGQNVKCSRPCGSTAQSHSQSWVGQTLKAYNVCPRRRCSCLRSRW